MTSTAHLNLTVPLTRQISALLIDTFIINNIIGRVPLVSSVFVCLTLVHIHKIIQKPSQTKAFHMSAMLRKKEICHTWDINS